LQKKKKKKKKKDPDSEACLDAGVALASMQSCAEQFTSQNRAVCSGTCADLFDDVATACGTDVSCMDTLLVY